jgi:glycosyltransferase involved in cell wall biosynthesis
VSDRVTTVVATRDRWSDLEASLPRHDGAVILVDNGSGDGTPEQVRRHFPEIEVIALPENRAAVARNLGVEAARTPYVAFADDDSWWAPGALDLAADLFDAHPRLGLVQARILVGPADRLDPGCAEMARSPLPQLPGLPGPALLGFIACGAVVRREAFLEVGGFDPVVEFAGEEERVALDLAVRGWARTYVAEVVAHHRPSPTRDPQDRRRTRIVRNKVLTAVMRRPWTVVATEVLTHVHDHPARRGVVEALRRSPRALAVRRVVPPELEAELALLR